MCSSLCGVIVYLLWWRHKRTSGEWTVGTRFSPVPLFPGGGWSGLPRRQSQNHSQRVGHHHGLCHQQGEISSAPHAAERPKRRLADRVSPSRARSRRRAAAASRPTPTRSCWPPRTTCRRWTCPVWWRCSPSPGLERTLTRSPAGNVHPFIRSLRTSTTVHTSRSVLSWLYEQSFERLFSIFSLLSRYFSNETFALRLCFCPLVRLRFDLWPSQ